MLVDVDDNKVPINSDASQLMFVFRLDGIMSVKGV